MASKKFPTNEDLTLDQRSNCDDEPNDDYIHENIEASTDALLEREEEDQEEEDDDDDTNKDVIGSNNQNKKKKRKRKVVEDDHNKMDFKAMYPRLSASMDSRVCMSPGHDDLRNLMKEKVGLLSRKNLMYLEREWNSISIIELKLYLRRLELIQDQMKAVTKAIKVNNASISFKNINVLESESYSSTYSPLLKEGICLVGNEKMMQLENKWTDIRVRESDALAKRLELENELSKLNKLSEK